MSTVEAPEYTTLDTDTTLDTEDGETYLLVATYFRFGFGVNAGICYAEFSGAFGSALWSTFDQAWELWTPGGGYSGLTEDEDEAVLFCAGY